MLEDSLEHQHQERWMSTFLLTFLILYCRYKYFPVSWEDVVKSCTFLLFSFLVHCAPTVYFSDKQGECYNSQTDWPHHCGFQAPKNRMFVVIVSKLSKSMSCSPRNCEIMWQMMRRTSVRSGLPTQLGPTFLFDLPPTAPTGDREARGGAVGTLPARLSQSLYNQMFHATFCGCLSFSFLISVLPGAAQFFLKRSNLSHFEGKDQSSQQTKFGGRNIMR